MDQILLYSTVVSSLMVALYSLIYIVNGSETTVQYSGTGCIVVKWLHRISLI